MAESSGTKPPQQERSRKTLEDLLAAGSRLLAERPFDDVTVQDIVAEAGSSAGSFYARFTDKNAFLHALQEQMAEQQTEAIRTGLGILEPNSVAYDDMCFYITRGLVMMHHRYRGLIRGMLVQARIDPELTKKAADLLVVGSKEWARVLDAPGYTFEKVCDEIIVGHRVLLAILDQSLFYDNFTDVSPTGMGHDNDYSRLVRIFSAAMDLGELANR